MKSHLLMMPPRLNVVQAEFFHVAMDSLEGVISECAERAADLSPIKTTVRFYDDYGHMTKFVIAAKALEKEHTEILENYTRAGALGKWFLNRKGKKLARKILAAKKFARNLAAELVHRTLITQRPIALERSDRSFRNVQGEELHELLEATDKSTSVWLFVFQPNRDLLADKNESVASFM